MWLDGERELGPSPSPCPATCAVCYTVHVKLLILYKPRSEHAHTVAAFVHDFQANHDTAARIELVDADSREGIATGILYDIMQYPALLVLRNDGSVLKSWEGDAMPLMDEVAYYAQSQNA